MADSKIIITEVTYNRIIYTIKGYVKHDVDLTNCKLIFYSEGKQLEIEPLFVQWNENKFKMLLNVESAYEENPIPSGKYYIILTDGEEKRYTAKYSQEALAQREEEEWGKQISVKKNAHHYIECVMHNDLDTEEVYLGVRTALPGKRKNFLKSQIKMWKDGIHKDLSDLKLKFYVKMFRLFNKRKKTGKQIFFTSGSRAEIGGNEEFIYKKMLERGLDKQYKFVFDFKSSIKIKYNFFKMIGFIRKLATSDVILIDDYYPEIYKFDYDKSVKIFQVWHACGAFKSLGLERMTKPGAPPINTRVHKCYTHVPVSSMHSAFHHQEAFGINLDKFYPVGVPRTDIFFDEEYKKETCQKMYEEIPMAKTAKRVIMYAPTFRGNNANNAGFPMEKIDLEKFGELCKRTDSCLIIKMHPFVTEPVQIPPQYADCIVDATSYREVNDILFITDVLITDYSSIIYEFSLLRRPMLFYAFDQIMYENSRDFYEPYEDIVPGTIIKDMDTLIEKLEKEDYDTERLEWFIQKNFTYTDGKATDRVVDLIIGKEK